MDISERYQRVLNRFLRAFEDEGISATNVDIAKGPYIWFRNALIRQEFFDACPDKREAIYCRLEDRFGLKRNTIEDIVRGER